MPSGTTLDFATLFDTHESERFDLHTRRLNEQMVRVLRTIGYDVGFCKGQGQYLYDRRDERYLDLLSGYGVFAVGRNHPTIRAALKTVLDADLPNLVQMDVSTLAGLLAERLLALVPHLEKVFFANSGAESVEKQRLEAAAEDLVAIERQRAEGQAMEGVAAIDDAGTA